MPDAGRTPSLAERLSLGGMAAMQARQAGRTPSSIEEAAMSGKRHWTPKVWQRPTAAFCPMPPTGWWCSAPQDHGYRGTSCPTRRARPWERSWWCGLRRKHVLRHKGRCWCGVTF